MNKSIIAVLLSFSLAACGGGGSDSNSNSGSPAAAKSMRLSFYGLPLVASSSPATSHAQVVARYSAASAPAVPKDPGATTGTLQAALLARGVPATVTAQVMDGTTLHQIVMGENNGLPPTPDQFKRDPSEWLIVNFELDDMATTWDVPSQAEAIAQFQQDLTVFAQRAAVSGKRVFAVQPILTCDASPLNTAAIGLQIAITQASVNSSLAPIGGLSTDVVTRDRLGADCRTPDAFLLNARMQKVADEVAERYQLSQSRE